MNIHELVGIFIGDGHIEYNKDYRNYWLEICGNVEEKVYFNKISKLLFNLTKRKPIIKEKKEKKRHWFKINIC